MSQTNRPKSSDLVCLIETSNALMERVEDVQSQVAQKLERVLDKVETMGLHVVTLDGELVLVRDRLKRLEVREEAVGRGIWAVITCTFLNILAWLGNHLPTITGAR